MKLQSIKNLFYCLLLLLCLLQLIAVSPALAKEIENRIITVRGEAYEDFAPDLASFYINVTGRSLKKEDAKNIHDKKLKDLLALCKKLKIEDKDLKTNYSQIAPNYEYTNGKRKFIDYFATTNIAINLHDLGNVTKLQDELIAMDFDDFQGPNYNLDKIYTYQEKILQKAVTNAREKADKIAKGVNETIDKVVEIKEEGTSYSLSTRQQNMYAAAKLGTMSDMSGGGNEAQPSGVVNVRSSVVASFTLKN